MIKKFKAFIFSIGIMILGIYLIGSYLGLTDQDRRGELEQLISHGIKTPGILKETYQQKTITKANLPVETYIIGYTYNDDDKEYEGEQTVHALPENPIVEVTYLENDPSVSSLDPHKELSEVEEGEGKLFTLLGGIGFFLLGSFMTYGKLRPQPTKEVSTEAANQNSLEKSKAMVTTNIGNPRPKESSHLGLSTKAKSTLRKNESTIKDQPKLTESAAQKRSTLSRRPTEEPLPDKSKWDGLKNSELKDFQKTDHNKFLPK